MGQLSETGAIFLSAGVPDPSAKHFLGEGDVSAISAAVSALLYVVLGRRRLVWGGQPAITPMVWAFAEAMRVDYGAWVTLYLSDLFENDFPEETESFQNVVVVDRVGTDRSASLLKMRERMIGESRFDAAVFIGGMSGLFEELGLFRTLAPQAKIIPIMSTGGAAQLIGKEVRGASEYEDDLDYVSLFHRLLDVSPNERRFPTPADQPVRVQDRIERPGES